MVGLQKFSTINLISEEYRKHQTEKGESSFEEPAADERAVLYGNLSAALKKLDRIEDAIKAAAESLQLKSDYLKVRIRRAELYEENDQPHESLEDWKVVAEQDPANNDAKRALRRLPPKVEIKNEQMKKEMMDGLKKLGNMCLRPFGLSTENFKFEDNGQGGYNMQFQQ
ncbi:Oidioi.mRNA.OKI2018_I69.XSR.g16380.t1.cds [Oikopleura dioica]|uniref:Oidioi.mRNA.OKI2018_I69.XSR.g16380.t1.cds n=1 Tax=Oikopleura dioica TaxID=34765 RepID=A0ABN7SJW0_OIKDI|nr:Oidioi.mRNA.OKI2018_I69.XSR.g16380.t1.cds [Oikopleura dioica]